MSVSNFKFIQSTRIDLYNHVVKAEQYAHSDPESTAVHLRIFAEKYVDAIYNDLYLTADSDSDLFAKIKNPVFVNATERDVIDKLHLIRMKGNKAAHGKGASVDDALYLVKEAFFLSAWLYMAHDNGDLDSIPDYSEPTAGIDLNKKAHQLEQELKLSSDALKEAKDEFNSVLAKNIELTQKLDLTNINTEHANGANISSAEGVVEKGRKIFNRIDSDMNETHRRISMSDVFAEYDLTNDQAELVKVLDDFLNNRDNNNNVFLLKGYAGTGKTFITKGLTEYFKSIRRNFLLAAPTGKASKVIANKTGCEAYTIHKTIYSFKDIKEYKADGIDGSETYKYYADLAVNDLSVDTVYIVDEASMISDVYNEQEFFRFGSGYLLKDFMKFVNLDHNDHRKKIIFIGDDAQLPPVGMKTSPALSSSYLSKEYGVKSIRYELTEVVRQKGGSGVLFNAIKLRDSLKEGVFNQLDIDLSYPDIKHVKHSDLINNYLDSCNRKINAESIVIAHSNADVAAFNKRIKKEFFPNQAEICAGDKVMATGNSDSPGFFISNGDFGLVRRVLSDSEKRTIKITRKNIETDENEVIEIPLKFRRVIVGFKDLEGHTRNFETQVVENLLYSDAPSLSSDENKALYVDFCMRHPTLKKGGLAFKETLRSDPYFNALRLKFGYAITCHKAQGSEWNHVFVKCKTHQSQLSADYFRWLYTAITRTAKNLYLLDEPHLKLGGGIKMVNDPGVSDTITHKKASLSVVPESAIYNRSGHIQQSIQNQDERFGIPENNVFLLEILNQVKSLLCNIDVSIDEIRHIQYQEAYYFKRGDEKTRVNISYGGKQMITSVVLPQLSELGSEVLFYLKPLEGKFIVGSNDKGQEFNFDEPFLKAFYERLKQLTNEAGIDILSIEDKQYMQKYCFGKSGETAVIDIYYNKKCQFTKCNANKQLSSSNELLKDVELLVTEGLS